MVCTQTKERVRDFIPSVTIVLVKEKYGTKEKELGPLKKKGEECVERCMMSAIYSMNLAKIELLETVERKGGFSKCLLNCNECKASRTQ